ncbi:MAG TPA: 3-keto-5-aminohexanoate cleavage protein [bacterium]|nr:3-keto-5-aminohexanoate cleavage protein [bacterium]
MPREASHGRVLVKACLNGGRHRAEHEAVPVTPDELAADGRAAVEAGAAALHVHPRGADERETLDAGACGGAITALRRACPGIPVGLSTAAWMAPDPRRRVALIESWTVLPDFASVNFSEPGTAAVCEALLRRGVGIEAGLWSLDDVRALIASDLAAKCLRILVEAQPLDPKDAVAAAAAMDAALDRAGIALPRVHHGEGHATWAVLDAALDRARDIRIGLEDTLYLPDGRRARGNADLVAEAVSMVRGHGHRPISSANERA